MRGDGAHENGAGRDGREVWTLNRGLVVLRPREPFIEWVRGLEAETEAEEADWVRSTSTAYLIPEFDWLEESWEWIEENCSLLFDLELSDWHDDPSRWPPDREWDTFRTWFDVEFIDTAWDLVDEPLSSDAPEP